MSTALRYVHAGDLDTNDAYELVWNVGDVNHRHQEIALAGDRVVGAWTYEVEFSRGRAHINSGRTDVMPRMRRKGVARALWLRGIARWKPTHIEATVGSPEGCGFLARMMSEIAYRAPGTWLAVKWGADFEKDWQSRCWYEARDLLRKLGEQAAATVQPPLQLVKGGAR